MYYLDLPLGLLVVCWLDLLSMELFHKQCTVYRWSSKILLNCTVFVLSSMLDTCVYSHIR